MSSFGCVAGALVDEQRQRAGDRDDGEDEVDVHRVAPVEAYCVSTPPSSRPTEAPLPAIAPKMPNALLRSRRSVKVVVSSDSAAGASSAPNAPCTARAATSIPKRLRGAADRGGDREADQAGDERPLAAEQVADPAAEQQQAAERERVGGDDPLAVCRW